MMAVVKMMIVIPMKMSCLHNDDGNGEDDGSYDDDDNNEILMKMTATAKMTIAMII